MEIATLAGGCFWCTEAIFRRLAGVKSVTPGYSGGTTTNPTYEQVSSGDTGHAEAIQIEFDAQEISFEQILEVFWNSHDPTTLNRQGADVGSQYRSAIFYHSEAQKQAAEKSKAIINNAVTEIVPFTKFYAAEDYHQNYFDKNKDAAYCRIVINPKLQKLEKYLASQK